MKFDVAVVADLCLDIVFAGDVTPIYGQVEQFVEDYQVELGGSAAIFASQLTKLGGRVGMLGTVGTDPFGNLLLQRLQELGISTEYIQPSPLFKTSVGLGLARGKDRAMLTYKGSLNDVTAERLRDSGLLEKSGHLHIASYFLLEQLQSYWLEELKLMKQTGITVSLDTNWAPKENWGAVHGVLEFVDVFIPNEEEALRISGKTNVEEAGAWLSRFGCLVVIKRGESGAMVFKGDAVLEYQVPGSLLKGLTIADTTGAGDNFDAGFIYAWLQHASLDECVELAMRCGTGSLSAMGGIAAQLTQTKKQLWNRLSVEAWEVLWKRILMLL
ncbi:carbohydrate kinase family protein [Pontibacter toksunensis]|uniref:Carbohydrate kinase family protein n=1 Tax=Pontibacter toksunensis TaxID=1332631 RepID=A0ABW6BST3_9BACT